MDAQRTNQQRVCDVIMSEWTRICEECFQQLVDRVHILPMQPSLCESRKKRQHHLATLPKWEKKRKLTTCFFVEEKKKY